MPDVTLTNTANNQLFFGVRLPNGALQAIKLNPGQTVPNAQYPNTIEESDLTGYARQLTRNGSLLIVASTVQTVTVEFQNSGASVARGSGAHTINVVVITSDGLPLEQEVQIEVLDNGNGDATDGSDYIYSPPNPEVVTFPAMTSSGSVMSVSLSLPSSSGSAEYAEFELQNPVNAEVGSESIYTLSIEAAAAAANLEVYVEHIDELAGPQGQALATNGEVFAFSEDEGGPAGAVIIELRNTGPGVLNVTGASLSGFGQTSGGLVGFVAANFSISPGGSEFITLDIFASSNFGPGAGLYDTVLDFTHDAPNELSIFQVTASVEVTGAPLD